jgi:hypothetical protein
VAIRRKERPTTHAGLCLSLPMPRAVLNGRAEEVIEPASTYFR